MNQVILFDNSDQQIGTCEKLAAHQQGLLHRAFSIFVFRRTADHQHLELLLQQRAQTKYHSGGLWSNTCCSHPKPGETLLTAAYRRLQEEFGFHLPLYNVGSFIYQVALDNKLSEHEYDHVLIGLYNDEVIKPNPEEIQDYRWINVTELMASISANPGHYTSWLKEAFTLALANKSVLTNLQ